MTNHHPVEVLDVHHLHLVETTRPQLTAEQTAAMDRRWEEVTAANPDFFDGPVVVCAGLDWKDPHTLVLTWYRAAYRLYVLRRDPAQAVKAPSVFVTVAQPTDDGRLVVGRMASSTAAPGRWQLPGGSMEPPADETPLDLNALRRHAARELAEEVGRTVPEQDMELWAVTRGDKGNIGVHFRAPVCPAAVIDRLHAAVSAADRAAGRTPELDRIAFISSDAEVEGLGGRSVDFLPVLAARHAANDQRRI
ncbi:NUDIX domain-containing protein [Streptomyces sp. NBC_00091]|uniref:NUDIX domain-containing protein n=1 Tax=Streptomyces sp. NBC_00091 TaxID=2975648 RepID=UPI00224D40DC|nr:NUDIX domain-containing protein [Streptomyces sp. NBC_00091]MCX5380364.1 NUDIX domain-containing protein [Streptomyces sp. NBC_00091]